MLDIDLNNSALKTISDYVNSLKNSEHWNYVFDPVERGDKSLPLLASSTIIHNQLKLDESLTALHEKVTELQNTLETIKQESIKFKPHYSSMGPS